MRHDLVAETVGPMLLSPLGAIGGVLSLTTFPFLRAGVLGTFVIVFAIIGFGLELRWPTALLAFAAALLGALAFTPLALMSGLYFPVALLPDWIGWTLQVQPFTPAVDLMRHLLMGTDLGGSAWLEVGRLIGFAALLLPAGVLAVHAALRFGRREGTIADY